jgi:hypothetical protein
MNFLLQKLRIGIFFLSNMRNRRDDHQTYKSMKECTLISSLLMFPQNLLFADTMRPAPTFPLPLPVLILLPAIIGHLVEAVNQGSATNSSSPPPPPPVPNKSPAVPVGSEILLPPVAFLQNPVSGLLPQEDC